MIIKVGINGFGRVGRIVSRACLLNPSLQLSAINDPAISVDYVSYLMKFDSTHGKLSKLVTHNDDEIIIDGLHVKVSHEKCPPDVPWQAAGVEYVVEASGMFTNFEKASGHLLSTCVKRVIVTAPSADIPMLILGVNDKNIPPDCRVISCTSSTLYCLAPIIKVLEDSYGVEEGFVTSIHAMTPSLKPLDGLCLRGRHWRDHRSIHQNIIPAPTGACKALGKIMPSVKDKLSGIAFRVPIVNVSVLDLTVRLQKNTNLQDIVKDVRQASKTFLRKIIKVSNEEAVSSDFMADSHSCIFDENSCIQLNPNFFKIICWYENEHSYACRVIDSIIFSENQFYLESPINMKCLKPIMSSKMLQTDTLACRCSKRSSESILNVSKDIAIETKSPTGSAVNVQKDFIAVPVKPKITKTDDLIKIWNHRSEMRHSLEPVRCSFFHSCMNYPLQPVKKIESNTQERLEDVKREFTKMVSITEDILRKTQSNQGVKSISKVDMKSGSSHLRVKEGTSKSDAKSYSEASNTDKIKSAPLDFNCSGDTIQVSNEKFTKSDTRSSSNNKSEFTDCHSNITGDSRNLLDITEDIKELVEEEKEALIELECKMSKQNIHKLNKFHSKPKTETIKKFDSKMLSNKQFRCVWNSPYDIIADKKIQKKIDSPKNESFVPDLAGSPRECVSQTEKTKVFLELDSLNNVKDEIDFKTTICESENEKSIAKNKTNNDELKVYHEKINIKTIDDELNELKEKCTRNNTDDHLKKHNIRFVENAQANSTGPTENNVANCDKLETKPVNVLVKLDDVNQSNPDMDLSINMLSGETSKYVSRVNTMTTLSGLCEERQDIYDKLDSTSGSESNNSFEVHERKSQVIQLTDLSNSLEDLARLNNICRIIEISDELSDKLFSALDESESDMKKKRWSFKDLCTKLKLDDFCNKVFGGTPV